MDRGLTGFRGGARGGLGGAALAGRRLAPPVGEDGDFGPELIANGGFASGSDWTLGDDGNGVVPTISGGTLNGAGGFGNGTASQAIVATEGLIYRVAYSVVSITTGNISIGLGTGGTAARTAAGDYAEYVLAGGGATTMVVNFASSDAVVDNVSIKEVLEQDDLGPELWPQPAFDASAGLTLTNCSVAGGKLLFEAAGALMRARLTSPDPIVSGDFFRYAITVDSTDDPILMGFGSALVAGLGAGSHGGTVRSSALNQFLEVRNGGDATAVIDNVSIKKVILPAL
ncbi:MAG TPA: hypothetical protein VGW34_10030 [Allosphingosinicella sp.]|nr:hypothetical protein [Allosphingosinicella sp.]